jgi:hypothetical protein
MVVKYEVSRYDARGGIRNQYFSAQVVSISIFENSEAGNLSKHWEFGRGGGDRTHRLFAALTVNPIDLDNSERYGCKRKTEIVLSAMG